MKAILLLAIVFFSLNISASVTAKLLGGASILLEDGDTKLLFDASFTRPGLLHWLGLQKFRSDKRLVESVIKRHRLELLDGVFVSHSHFDHSVDAPTMASLTGAPLFADKNLEKIASAHKDRDIGVISIQDAKKIKIGGFYVTPFEIQHEKILGFDFLPGSVPEEFDFDFYDYRSGSTWMFLVEHAKGVILIEEAERAHIKKLHRSRPDITRVDALIQGVTRNNQEELLNGYLINLKPVVFVPNHFDNFFLSYDLQKFRLFPWSRLSETMEKIKSKIPSTEVIVPKLGQEIRVLK